MYPMLEMASPNHVVFIKEVLYKLTDNSTGIPSDIESQCLNHIISKSPYKRIGD